MLVCNRLRCKEASLIIRSTKDVEAFWIKQQRTSLTCVSLLCASRDWNHVCLCYHACMKIWIWKKKTFFERKKPIFWACVCCCWWQLWKGETHFSGCVFLTQKSGTSRTRFNFRTLHLQLKPFAQPCSTARPNLTKGLRPHSLDNHVSIQSGTSFLCCCCPVFLIFFFFGFWSLFLSFVLILCLLLLTLLDLLMFAGRERWNCWISGLFEVSEEDYLSSGLVELLDLLMLLSYDWGKC